MFKAVAAPKCPRCNDSVYANEQVLGAGKAWHKRCFNCTQCRKTLDSTSVAENDGQIYCKGCHAKNFGPKGYGYGGGAGVFAETGVPRSAESTAAAVPALVAVVDTPATPSTSAATNGTKCGSCGAVNPTGKFCSSCGNILSMTTSTQPSAAAVFSQPAFSQPAVNQPAKAPAVAAAPAGDKCGTCGKTVYFAEKLMGPGNRVYHKMCFKCSECRKMLDAGNCSDKEGVVFCKGCYGAKFGPKGFGFGSALSRTE